MFDQAQVLRIMARKQKSKQTKIITVTSGKGGVGKSSLVLNLAISLKRKGRKVLVIDTDFGFSNIDVMLGVKTKYDLMSVINHNKDIRDIIEVGHEGVQFISGGSGVYELTKLSEQEVINVVNSIKGLENIADTIIFDTGAGVSDNILRLITASDETILVTTPEPTAIVDAYALIKIISEEGISPNLSLVVNQADNPKDAQMASEGLTKIVKKNFDIDINKLGFISRDICMHKAVTRQIPVLVSYPKSIAAINIDTLAGRFLDIPAKQSGKTGLASFLEKFLAKKNTSLG